MGVNQNDHIVLFTTSVSVSWSSQKTFTIIDILDKTYIKVRLIITTEISSVFSTIM